MQQPIKFVHRLLNRFDPGWLFLGVGVVACAAGLLIPVQQDVTHLREQQAALRHEEFASQARLNAYANFLEAWSRRDEDLLRRIAAAELHVIPAGDNAVMIDRGGDASILDFLDAAPPGTPHITLPPNSSTLERLVEGPRRLLVLSAGSACILVGLFVGPGGGFISTKSLSPYHPAP